jgi:hypothetical protein
MNGKMKWLGLWAALAVAAAASVQASPRSYGTDRRDGDDLIQACMTNVKQECESWAAKGGGGGAPHGLSTDAKAELAIGEKYVLSGTIDINGDDPYLRINFRSHPWLAGKVRARNPFYRINDSVANWTKYDGRDITIVAFARYSAWKDRSGRMLLEIYLEPTDEPVITGLQKLPRDAY